MHRTLSVQCFQSGGCITGDAHRLGGRQRAGLETRCQAASGGIFRDQKETLPILLRLVHTEDMGSIQLGSHLGFHLKTSA